MLVDAKLDLCKLITILFINTQQSIRRFLLAVEKIQKKKKRNKVERLLSFPPFN